ncbi:MAG TPA: hypothetical protein VEK79_25395, partial [Thermoanaerobaculia bacterium]|nr:hypothetical protein [Thermoanaerobaculia bacterium]
YKRELAEAADEPYATRATISILLGETERALSEVEESVKRRERDAIYFNTSTSYAALRGQPRFQKVLETMGFSGRAGPARTSETNPPPRLPAS